MKLDKLSSQKTSSRSLLTGILVVHVHLCMYTGPCHFCDKYQNPVVIFYIPGNFFFLKKKRKKKIFF